MATAAQARVNELLQVLRKGADWAQVMDPLPPSPRPAKEEYNLAAHLTETQMAILDHLCEGHLATVLELAHLTRKASDTVRSEMKPMEAKGWVSLEKLPYKSRYKITDLGRTAACTPQANRE